MVLVHLCLSNSTCFRARSFPLVAMEDLAMDELDTGKEDGFRGKDKAVVS